MKFLNAARQIGLLLMIATTCVMALPVSAPPAGNAPSPHRISVSAPGVSHRVPYAPPPKSISNARAGAKPRSFSSTATVAVKKWYPKAWMSTGSIERQHFWLTHGVDRNWHNLQIALYGERLFWWRHVYLDNLYWLGQGWEYVHGTTRPTSRPGEYVPVELVEGIRPSDLALRVRALHVLHSLRMSNAQFHTLRASLDQMSNAGEVLDADVIDDDLQSHPSSISSLNRLYTDLVQSDEDQAAVDRDQLLQMQADNQFSADPTVYVSDDARSQAQVIFDQLTPDQVAAYVAQRGQIVPDTAALLFAGLDQCRHLSNADYIEYSYCLSDRIAVLTTGLSAEANAPVIHQVEHLLDQARNLSDDEFAARKAEFQRQADRIASQGFPTDLIAHAVQWDLASFLANPQAKAMLSVQARQMGAS